MAPVRPVSAHIVSETSQALTFPLARPMLGRMGISLELFIVLLLVLLNGLFAMSELALVSVRRARLVWDLLGLADQLGVDPRALPRRRTGPLREDTVRGA